eukprot:3487033-Rhodomonas_salina.2
MALRVGAQVTDRETTPASPPGTIIHLGQYWIWRRAVPEILWGSTGDSARHDVGQYWRLRRAGPETATKDGVGQYEGESVGLCTPRVSTSGCAPCDGVAQYRILCRTVHSMLLDSTERGGGRCRTDKRWRRTVPGRERRALYSSSIDERMRAMRSSICEGGGRREEERDGGWRKEEGGRREEDGRWVGGRRKM